MIVQMHLGTDGIWRDDLGLIVQRDGDAGDCSANTGTYWAARAFNEGPHAYLIKEGRYLRDLFQAEVFKLEVLKGILVRHPRQEKHKSPSMFSRDQQDSVVIALGAFEEWPLLRRVWEQHWGRWLRYQNGDWFQPQTVGIYLRAFRVPAYPILWLTDFALLINAFLIFARTVRAMDNSDDRNHVVRLRQAYEIYLTPIGWIAFASYKRIRPHTPGSSLEKRDAWLEWRGDVDPRALPPLEDDAVMGAFVWYFRAQNGGNPPIAEAYREFILKGPQWRDLFSIPVLIQIAALAGIGWLIWGMA